MYAYCRAVKGLRAEGVLPDSDEAKPSSQAPSWNDSACSFFPTPPLMAAGLGTHPAGEASGYARREVNVDQLEVPNGRGKSKIKTMNDSAYRIHDSRPGS